MPNPEHYHIDYLSKEQKSYSKLKKLKFVTFLPNVKEAENPFPGALSPLFVYDMNIWFPVENIEEGRAFPVK